MSVQSPPSWFEAHGKTTDTEDFKRRKAKLLEELPGLIDKRKSRGRVNSFYPYLLIRSVLGDRGDRPINVPYWESPDIWTVAGEPASAPAVPATHEGTIILRQPHTVYAHVWNLGFAPLAGIHLEFYSFPLSLNIDGSDGNLIGTARCELAARGMPGSHKLVKCPKAWHPVLGHESLVVRASGIGDPIGANAWWPFRNRHVAQRSISVFQRSGTGVIRNLLAPLKATRPSGARVQLIQVGAKEGEIVRHLIAPRLRLASLDTHILSEINVAGQVTHAQVTRAPAGMLAPVHPLAAGGAPRAPSVVPNGRTRVIDPSTISGVIPPADPLRAADLTDLFGSVRRLQVGADAYGPPEATEAYILRLASYCGEQLVGGHTLVIAGGS